MFFKINVRTPMKKLMEAYCTRLAVSQDSMGFFFDACRLYTTDTADALDMEDEDEIDAIDALLLQPGDIGTWGSHRGTVGIQYLEEPSCAVLQSPAAADAITRALGRCTSAGFVLTGPLVPHWACDKLKQFADSNAIFGVLDLKLSLSRAQLMELVGSSVFDRLCTAFGGPFDAIKVRRAEPTGACINFHLDVNHRTMQVALTDECIYEGGRLVFATCHGIEVPARPAGSATIHDNRVAHGVTTHLSGIRYGLFLLDSGRGSRLQDTPL